MRYLVVFLFVLSLLNPAPVFASSLSTLFQKVSPSVCVIKTVQKDFDQKEGFTSGYGLGSGVLISEDGWVLTAAHVVHTADLVSVEFTEGEKIQAKVLGSVPTADVALLQLETVPENIKPSPLADSDLVKIGDQVVVVGAPYGLAKTLTVGYISGRHQEKDVLGNFSNMEVFQSDAAVNTGNSGGPMFNLKGEVVGVVSFILSRSGGFEGVSFAVTANVAKELFFEKKPRWAGLEAVLLSKELSGILNLPQSSGLLVQKIASGSLADALGLKPGLLAVEIEKQEVLLGGDIILSVAGIEIDEEGAFREKVRGHLDQMKSGEKLFASVLRAGEVISLSAKLP